MGPDPSEITVARLETPIVMRDMSHLRAVGLVDVAANPGDSSGRGPRNLGATDPFERVSEGGLEPPRPIKGTSTSS
ncbi:MAG: hypothetical protein QOE97_1165 [Pseudonocardiales bacterium]|nr:hypothetical protein [Pseudonocardiales bacterium]